MQPTSIGSDCEFYPNVTIYPVNELGDRVIVHAEPCWARRLWLCSRSGHGHYEEFPQAGRLEIGDDVEIGANSTVDRGALDATRIGRGAKIDNLVHIGHNCQIGEDVRDRRQTGFPAAS